MAEMQDVSTAGDKHGGRGTPSPTALTRGRVSAKLPAPAKEEFASWIFK